MAQDFSAVTTTTSKADYRISPVSPDRATSDETFWDSPNYTKWNGIYLSSKAGKVIDNFADWILGLGYTVDESKKRELEHIQGNGKESFDDIMWNGIVTKKVNGESFTLVMRDSETIVNMRPLSPEFCRVVYTRYGRIKEYRYYENKNKNGSYTTYKSNEVLHMINDKIVDEIHGRSVIERIEWNVSAQEEAKRVYRKLVWRSGVVRVIEVDTNNATELATLKAQYKIAEEKGDVLLLPKDKARAVDWKPNIDVANILAWLDSLENDFFIEIGFPRDLSGASTSATEAGMKMSYVNHEPLYEKEVRELESCLWNQLGIKIKFNRVNSMMPNVQENETKNTGQTNLSREGQ